MTLNKPLILILMSGFPYPPNIGGKLRDFNLIKSISKDFTIHLLVLENSPVEHSSIREMEKYCDDIEIINNKYRHSIFLFLKSIITKIPYKVLQHTSSTFTKKVAELLKNKPFSILFCDHIYLTNNLPNNINIPVIPHTEDAFSFLYKQVAENSPFIRRLYASIQWKILLKYELSKYNKYNNFVAVSEIEKKRIKDYLPDINIPVIPNGVDLDYFSPSNEIEPDLNSLVFVGLMDSFPNIDAVEFFFDEVYPQIASRIPEVKVYVVGKNPVERVKKYQKDDKVFITGTVDDIRKYVYSSGIFIVPLRYGTGTRLKILEAMAMGKTIVATSIGCEGIDVTNGKDIIIADTPSQFADAIIKLISNPDYCREIGEHAKDTVKKYDWELIGNSMNNFLRSLLE